MQLKNLNDVFVKEQYQEQYQEQQEQYQEQQEQYQEQEQEQYQGCIASHLNRCSNDINTYDVDYYSYPNFIGQQELHIFQVNICNYHYNKIRGTMSDQLRNERILPHVLAHTEQDAVDSILQCLHYEPTDCVCDNYGNELHKALIAYTRGEFMIPDDYYCDNCEFNHPSWRDGLEAFNDVLMSRNDIERMIENRPNMVLERNNEGKLPIEIIQELIDMLEESRLWEHVKNQEQGIAGVNAEALRGIMEMIIQNGGGVDDEEEERLHPYY